VEDAVVGQEQEEDAEVEVVVVEEEVVVVVEGDDVEGLDYTEYEQYVDKNGNINLTSFLGEGVPYIPMSNDT
jgi:hypothetical protein